MSVSRYYIVEEKPAYSLPTGTTSVHKDLEQSIARFLKKDDAIVFNMGFATNATGIPSITKKVRRNCSLIFSVTSTQQGDLIISDRLNHTSIVSGCRSSGAFIRTFKHNGLISRANQSQF